MHDFLTHPRRKIESPEQFLERASEYFADCFEKGKQIKLMGLILAVGLHSKSNLDRYQKEETYAEIIGWAKGVVAFGYEEMLTGENKPTGAIFALKNMGWSDRQEVEHSGRVDGLTVQVVRFSDITPDGGSD